MAESSGPVELVLEDEAQRAIQQIASLLAGKGGKAPSEEEAVQRALGTELYLLDQVRNSEAKIFVETKRGRFELDLLSR
jgi:hypothetical protein